MKKRDGLLILINGTLWMVCGLLQEIIQSGPGMMSTLFYLVSATSIVSGMLLCVMGRE